MTKEYYNIAYSQGKNIVSK